LDFSDCEPGCRRTTSPKKRYRRPIRAGSSAQHWVLEFCEPGIFLLDDVAFIQVDHGMRIGELIAQKGIRKKYYLETRGDILLRNKEVFKFWRDLGLEYMFLGIEAIDEEGLKRFRKRVSLSQNFEALEFARSLGVTVAINIIADPSWDRNRFKVIREWCMEIPTRNPSFSLAHRKSASRSFRHLTRQPRSTKIVRSISTPVARKSGFATSTVRSLFFLIQIIRLLLLRFARRFLTEFLKRAQPTAGRVPCYEMIRGQPLVSRLLILMTYLIL
jgi:hypothetical protein